MASEPIFRGEQSIPFWDAINAAEQELEDPGVLYDFGCRAQRMERSHDDQQAEIERLRATYLKVTATLADCLRERDEAAAEIERLQGELHSEKGSHSETSKALLKSIQSPHCTSVVSVLQQENKGLRGLIRLMLPGRMNGCLCRACVEMLIQCPDELAKELRM